MPQPQPKAITRVVLFLTAHYATFSLIGYAAGVGVLFYLPEIARKTYFSENALLPGRAETAVRADTVAAAVSDIASLTEFLAAAGAAGAEGPSRSALIRQWTRAQLHTSKIESYTQYYGSTAVVNASTGAAAVGETLVAVVRGQRAPGHEGLVVVTPVGGTGRAPHADVLAVAAGLNAARVFRDAAWLAKDVAWLLTDDEHGECAGTQAWLHQYFHPHGDAAPSPPLHVPHLSRDGGSFKRVGYLVGGLVVDVRAAVFDSFQLSMEGLNGNLPNLDFVNVVNFLAGRVEKKQVLLGDGGTPRSSSPVRTLFDFLLRQAIGIPTGSHGPFKDYGVEALTLRALQTQPGNAQRLWEKNKGKYAETLMRVIEGSMRSCSNLLERFHQSFNLYLMVALDRFVPIEMYMPALLPLLAALVVSAGALFMYGHRPAAAPRLREDDPLQEEAAEPGAGKEGETAAAARSDSSSHAAAPAVTHRWVPAAVVVTSVHGACVALFLGLLLPSPAQWAAWGAGTVLAAAAAAWGAVILAGATVTRQLAAAAAAVDGSGRRGAEAAEVVPLGLTIVLMEMCVQAGLLGAVGCLNFGLAWMAAVVACPQCFAARPRPRSRAASRAGQVERNVRLVVLLATPAVAIGWACHTTSTAPAALLFRMVSDYKKWGTWLFPVTGGLLVPCTALCLLATLC